MNADLAFDRKPGGVNVANTNNSQTESELMLGLLRAVQQDDALTQRSAARELGVALGLVNTYLKRCVKKGFVKVMQAPSSRYIYYLTPKGFAEKSRLTAEFLSQSLSLFRQAQCDYEALFEQCIDNGWTKVALCGVSDLTEVAALYARDYPLQIVGVFAPSGDTSEYSQLPVHKSLKSLGRVDAYVITALTDSQSVYDDMASQVAEDRVLTPALLEIYRDPKKQKGGK